MQYWTGFDSPLGPLTLVSDGTRLIGLWFDGQKYDRSVLGKGAVRRDDLAVFGQARDRLPRYFAGDKPEISSLPLRFIGSDFRRMIWSMLCEIPYGEVTTYGALARKAAARMRLERMSAQAVGGAVGHNPISIIVPCHRVVGASGSLTGYAGGIERKIRLLTHEGADLSKLFVPAKGTAL